MTAPGHAVASATADRLNGLDDASAAVELASCCAARSWLDAMLDARPYRSDAELFARSDGLVAALDDAGLAEALAAHGRIGERREGQDREAAWSRDEQAAALAAGGDVQARLARGNRAYEERFGRIFLVRAAGRTAEEMLAALHDRLRHDEETERTVVLHELTAIVRLRLTALGRA